MNRRNFLALVGAAGTSLAAAHRKPVVAAHPWVYAATLPNNDITPVLPQIFADMSWAGIEAIELMHTALAPDDAVDRIGELSHRHNLPVIGMSYAADMWKREDHDAILDQASVLIPRLAKLGGRLMGTSVGTGGKPCCVLAPGKLKTHEMLDAQAEILKKLMALCAANRVVLNLHNHVYEVENDEQDLGGTLARIPGIKLGPDINWLVRAKVDPVDFIRRHGKQIVYAHLRDQKSDGRWPEAMGEGNMDYGAIGRAFRAIPFSGDVGIELAYESKFKPARPLREDLKISRAYVRRVMGW
jgi:sugar phosphate isomerase/epimerase